MKIAVTAVGNDRTAAVDPRFGRARWILIFDTENDRWEALDNTESMDAASGAGTMAAQRVIDRGVECVVTGACGPKARRALETAGVRIVIAENVTAEEAARRATEAQ